MGGIEGTPLQFGRFDAGVGRRSCRVPAGFWAAPSALRLPMSRTRRRRYYAAWGFVLEAEGTTIPAYYDPSYNTMIELLRFDSRRPSPESMLSSTWRNQA